MNSDTKHMEAATSFPATYPDDKSSAPPPPYSEDAANQQTPSDIKDLSSQRTSLSSETSSLPSKTQPSRTLHCVTDGLSLTSARVLDTDKSTLAYSIKYRLRKAHLSLVCATTGVTVGTVSYHCRTTRIDITVRDTPLSLTSTGMFSCGYSFESPALGGQMMKWKTQKRWGTDLVCVDERGEVLARYVFSRFSLRKCGRLELFVDGGDEKLVDEVLVSGLAVVEWAVMTRQSSVPVPVVVTS
ncbi:hypothetical protein G7Y79_00034g069740 [Physcia stellaris]|nr:hypothetical protein G7Y79_00034g069740 [Physcia stellaris]